ncbi:MAG: M23 family metallopeptidase [Clostridia bacterium]|nr:M23 family metallopeptidase [Clostridia bacterium]
MKKNKLIIALLIVALFIPTYIGIANYIYMNSTPVGLNEADTIIIKDSVSGMVYKENSDSAIMTLFKEMDTTATPISSLPSMLAGQGNFSVTVYDGSRETSSQYYILKDETMGYYVNSQGSAFSLNEEKVAEFLNTKYAQGLYEDAAVPTLSNGSNEILPASYDWSYIPKSGDVIVSASLTKTAEETVTYTSKSGLSLTFSRQPSTFDITAKAEDGTELYSGDFANLTVDTKANPVVVIEAKATWDEEETLPYGSANYTFILDIEAQPEFFITYSGKTNDAFVLGDVAMITAASVKDPENLTVSVSPALTHDGEEILPVFYTDGTNSYALLPTAYDSEAGEYTITLSYAGINETLVMSVGDKTFKNAGTHPASSAKISASYTDETLAAYDAKVKEIISGTDSSVKYFTADIFYSASSAYSNTSGGLFGYGRTKTLKDGSGIYRNEGLDYTMSAGSKVQAVMDGKVIYVGYTEFSGDIVVVDHGYGLMSWYHNLDKNSIKVSEGDTVKRGGILCDKIGDSGFTNGSTLHQRLTVNGVPVCEYDLWEVGLTFEQ